MECLFTAKWMLRKSVIFTENMLLKYKKIRGYKKERDVKIGGDAGLFSLLIGWGFMCIVTFSTFVSHM